MNLFPGNCSSGLLALEWLVQLHPGKNPSVVTKHNKVKKKIHLSTNLNVGTNSITEYFKFTISKPCIWSSWNTTLLCLKRGVLDYATSELIKNFKCLAVSFRLLLIFFLHITWLAVFKFIITKVLPSSPRQTLINFREIAIVLSLFAYVYIYIYI